MLTDSVRCMKLFHGWTLHPICDHIVILLTAQDNAVNDGNKHSVDIHMYCIMTSEYNGNAKCQALSCVQVHSNI